MLLGVMSSRFIRVVTTARFLSFIRLIFHHMCIPLEERIPSFFQGHLVCFHILAILNAPVNIRVLIYLQDPDFNFWVYCSLHLIYCFILVSVICGHPWSENTKWKHKQFISFKLHDILSSVIKSCAVLLNSTLDVNYPIVQHMHMQSPPPLGT